MGWIESLASAGHTGTVWEQLQSNVWAGRRRRNDSLGESRSVAIRGVGVADTRAGVFNTHTGVSDTGARLMACQAEGVQICVLIGGAWRRARGEC